MMCDVIYLHESDCLETHFVFVGRLEWYFRWLFYSFEEMGFCTRKPFHISTATTIQRWYGLDLNLFIDKEEFEVKNFNIKKIEEDSSEEFWTFLVGLTFKFGT